MSRVKNAVGKSAHSEMETTKMALSGPKVMGNDVDQYWKTLRIGDRPFHILQLRSR